MYVPVMTLSDKDISGAIDWLIYANYKHNRLISPDTPVTSYMKIYPKHLVLEMEALLVSTTTKNKPLTKYETKSPLLSTSKS